MTSSNLADPPSGSRQPDWRIPDWLSIPSLEVFLGHPVQELSWTDIETFCADHARENQFLEFKGEDYNDLADFAGDVAAMANAAGGLIIIGVSERDECANWITAVPLTAVTERRLRGCLIERVRPVLDGITVGTISSPTDSGEGVVLVLVPPGPDSPYTATSGKRNAWPVREGAQTRHMSEWEIASRYRARFSTDHTQETRMTTVANEGLRHLVRDSQVWLALAAVPRVGGRWEPDRDGCREWVIHQQDQTLPGMKMSASTGRVTRGRRRVVMSNSRSGPSTDSHLELHSDGSSFAAVVVGYPGSQVLGLDRLPGGAGAEAISFDVTSLELWVLHFVQLLGLHAVQAAATGDLLIRAQLVAGTKPDESVFESGVPSATYPLVATEGRAAGHGYLLWGSHLIQAPTPLDAWMPIAATSRREELIKTAAELSTELIAECGQLPTTPLLRPDGTVSKDLTQDRSSAAVIRTWAGDLAT